MKNTLELAHHRKTPMIRINATSLILASLLSILSACGGGGGSAGSNNGNAAAASTPNTPRSYTQPQPTVGDFLSYKQNTTYPNAATPASEGWHTTVTSIVNSNGTASTTQTDSAINYPRLVTGYDAAGAITTDRYVYPGSCVATYSPAWIEIPATLSLGLTWDTNTSYICGANNIQGNSKGVVVAIESITVPAGTFTALKIVYIRTLKYSDATAVMNNTCWRDTISGADVKCETVSTTTALAPGSTPDIYHRTKQLLGYNSVAANRQQLNVERYAGSWSGTFTGQADGDCKVDITPAGLVSGYCDSSSYGNAAVALNGTVDAQGAVRFSIDSNGVNGPVFNGKFLTPLQLTGSWSAGTASGTWIINHN